MLSVDTSAALAVPGVVGCYTVADVPGHNMFGVVVMDEPFLADGELLYLGQPVAVVAAESPAALEKARKAVRVEYRAAEPLLDLEESIRRKKFLGPRRRIIHQLRVLGVQGGHRSSSISVVGADQHRADTHPTAVVPAALGAQPQPVPCHLGAGKGTLPSS